MGIRCIVIVNFTGHRWLCVHALCIRDLMCKISLNWLIPFGITHTTHNHSYRKVHSKSEISHLYRYFFQMMYHKTWPIHDSYDCIVFLTHLFYFLLLSSISYAYLSRWYAHMFFFLLNNKKMIFDICICISMHGMVQWALNRYLCSFFNSESTMCTSNRRFICILSHLKWEKERKKSN